MRLEVLESLWWIGWKEGIGRLTAPRARFLALAVNRATTSFRDRSFFFGDVDISSSHWKSLLLLVIVLLVALANGLFLRAARRASLVVRRDSVNAEDGIYEWDVRELRSLVPGNCVSRRRNLMMPKCRMLFLVHRVCCVYSTVALYLP